MPGHIVREEPFRNIQLKAPGHSSSRSPFFLSPGFPTTASPPRSYRLPQPLRAVPSPLWAVPPPSPLRAVPASPQPLRAVPATISPLGGPATVSPQGGSRRDVPRTPCLVLAERQPGPAGALG
ncbi:hypothetical protein Nmel_013372 [Mimus melanotis]